jgi:hypothetical protein
MSAVAWVFLGALGASVLWVIALAKLFNVLVAQRRALTLIGTTARLYREQRDESDGQIRAVLDQNERLAHLLLEARAQASASVVAIPQTFFHAQRES